MDKLMTTARVAAAANINRWRGWTRRPYSILEHQVIGAELMRHMNLGRSAIVAFLHHDMHETEIVGDVPTPDKRLYVNSEFDVACERFDTQLGQELRLRDFWWRDSVLKSTDRLMFLVENSVMSTRPDQEVVPMEWDSRMVFIRDRMFAFETPQRVIARYRSLVTWCN